MTNLASSAGIWVARGNTHWGPSRQWNQGLSWEAMYGTSQSDLTAMTNDRNYWKTTVAHDDPNVWDNRYNAGYSAGNTAGYNAGYAAGVAAGGAAAPPVGTIILTASRGDKGQVSVTLNKAGYWFAYCNGGFTGDQSDVHYEGDVSMDSAPTYEWRTHNGRSIIATGWSAPIFAGNGQPLAARWTAGGDNPALDWAFTLYACFVPTKQYPQ